MAVVHSRGPAAAVRRGALWVALLVLTVLFLAPLLFMLSTSFKGQEEATTLPN